MFNYGGKSFTIYDYINCIKYQILILIFIYYYIDLIHYIISIMAPLLAARRHSLEHRRCVSCSWLRGGHTGSFCLMSAYGNFEHGKQCHDAYNWAPSSSQMVQMRIGRQCLLLAARTQWPVVVANTTQGCAPLGAVRFDAPARQRLAVCRAWSAKARLADAYAALFKPHDSTQRIRYTNLQNAAPLCAKAVLRCAAAYCMPRLGTHT